ncbi:cation-transporting P-type ATPase [Escherichia coli]
MENVRHPSGRVKSGGSGICREQHGENKLPAQQPSPWWVHLWVCYRNPFNILLTILGAISYATEDLFAAGRYRANGRYFYVAELYSGSTFH